MTIRTLRPIKSSQGCDMAGEDFDCDDLATYLLDAPASYVIPLYLCDKHAEEERCYHGAVVQR